MPTPGRTDEQLREIVEMYRAMDYNANLVAERIGKDESSVRRAITQARAKGFIADWERRVVGKVGESGAEPPEERPAFEIPHLPSDQIPVEDLIRLRCEHFDRKSAAEEARRLIPVNIKIRGPIGLCHVGDPHVDDDGCDFPRLLADIETIRDTEGMFGGNIGDLQNNWVGRLARLYGEQSTSAKQAWQLTEWLIKAVPWLYLVKGNHDLWSGAGDPIDWMRRGAPGVTEPWQVRFALRFPNGREVRVNARHDFAGHSMWNPVHGLGRAAQMGFRDHILVAGHRHTSGYMILKDPATGLLSHGIRVGGYKVYDHFAKTKGFPDANFAPSAVNIIDPDAADETQLVTTFFNVQEAAEYLKYKRRKAAA